MSLGTFMEWAVGKQGEIMRPGSGSRTADDMGHAWVNVTYFEDEEYEAEGIDAGEKLTHEFDDLAGGETMTTVTFSEPGQYRLMAIGNDDSSAPGDGSTRQCCWTTAHVDVTVNP